MRVAVPAAALALALVTFAPAARAALTSSEKAQIRDFTSAAQLENAGRVRALVARTDLSEAESIAAMSDALEAIPFDTSRARFVKEVLFGPSSAPSRAVLVTATVRGLLARADAVHQKFVGGLDHEPRALAELASIYAFLDGEIANAGRTGLPGHDPNAGIPSATYEECSKALRDHVEKNARWLKGDLQVAEPVARVRAQAQVALFDMLPDGPTRRADAADRLGLKGPRRQMLVDWGVLFADAGKLDEASLEKVRRALARLPVARTDVSVIFAGEDRGPIRARSGVAYVSTDAPGSGASPFGDELTSSPYDAKVGGVILDLATLATKRTLEDKPKLKEVATRDAKAAAAEGRFLGIPRGANPEQEIGAAVQAVLVDAPRATDLAMVRFLGRHGESLALLSDAIGVLAAQSPEPIDVGKAGGTTTLTGIRLAPSGVALGFTLEGNAWTIERAEGTYAVAGARRGSQPVSLLHLATAKTPLRDGDRWAEGDLAFVRLRGAPKVGIVPSAGSGPTLKMSGHGAKGYDAIGMTPPDADVVVEADLTVRGGPAGIGLRMGNGRDAVRGAMLVFSPGARTSILTSDDTGFEALLAAPVEPAIETPVHVKLTLRGTKLSAVVGTTKLEGTLPASLAKGDVGLVAARGASVEAASWTVKKPK